MAALLFLFLFYPLALLIVWRVLSSIYRGLFSPLRHIPGPFLARFTDLWYLGRVRRGHFERDNIALHRKHGPIVRYGPNRYSFDHPQAAPIIYGVGQADKFAKSSFYRTFATPNPNQPSLFAHANIKEHAQMRRLYQGTHAMSALVSYEDFVNECTDLFDQRLREMAEQPGSTRAMSVVDMGHWFQCYAFDVISMITYSERLGFLDRGTDIAGIMASLEGFLNYASSVGIYSWMHPFLFTARNWFAGKSGSGIGYVIQFTERLMREHQSKPKHLDIENEDTQQMDFLSKYEARRRKDPLTYNSWYVLSGCASNMTAGSDTTGISLSAVLFFLMNHPEATRKLRLEVDQHHTRARDSRNLSFKETQEMPYLQAVIKEALRLHPAVGLPLERVVPEGGATIAGQFFPSGTTVGINPWVEHASLTIFGPDPEVFRPERWLESDKQKLDAMNRHWVPFGMGARTCIGRHISTLEISKLIPRIVRDFNFVFPGDAPTKGEWKTTNYWFVKPKGFKVGIRIRQ
ncbi:cytochrome P450 [Ilyonectria sp. MPI-CAGE-AT-0026]|nr:cytochrome P450 [Ilyonectria sp. MPI-CAGE-AT-0026]